MRGFILYILIIFTGLSCTHSVNNEGDDAVKSWEKLQSEPSLSLEPSDESKIINYNIFIKDNLDVEPNEYDSFNGSLVFDDGSLTLQNAQVKLSNEHHIRFIDEQGSISIEESILSASYIENAKIDLNSDAELHLYSARPLRNAYLNVIGADISIYFHGLNFNYLNEYFFNSGMLSIDDEQLQSSIDINKFSGRQIGIKSFDDGVCLIIN